jgi:putative ABC transport system permease protein
MSTLELDRVEKAGQAVPVPKQKEEDLEDLETSGIGLGQSIALAWTTLMANKVRTVLTALGVIIGVASVVALLSIGNGTQQQITDQITSNGANLLTIRASGAAGGGNATLTTDDVAAIQDPVNVPDATAVSPEGQGIAAVAVGSVSENTIVIGAAPIYQTIHADTMQFGTFITDDQAKQNVVVLGATAYTKLFPNGGDPTGQTVRVKSVNFMVIGVLQSKGTSVANFDDSGVIVPLAIGQQRIFGGRVQSANNKAAVASIVVQATGQNTVASAQDEITSLLRSRHNLPADGSADDFTVSNQQDLINTLTSTTRTLTLFLGAIAAISLIVGGIGIMNIMLVSVRERTREIGLRKAIGARERDVLTQFLIEALMLSTTGGLIGLGIGVLIAILANQIGQIHTYVSPDSVALAVGFAMAVGLFFGIEPARRAAKLDPIEALRYE